MEDRLFALQQFQAAHDRSGTAHHSQTEARRHSVLDDGQRTPILVRTDGARFGLHCLEAVKALGEKNISPSLSPRGKHQMAGSFIRSRTGPSSRVSTEPVQINNYCPTNSY
jgi:hypothetical protein